MIRILAIAFLIAGLLAMSSAMADTCMTPYGSCPLAGGSQNGATCYCSSPNGSLGGRAQVDGSPGTPGPAPLPTICCTAAGRIPFANASTPVGGACAVPTIRGPVSGQTCY